jgi:hypothetical protein
MSCQKYARTFGGGGAWGPSYNWLRARREDGGAGAGDGFAGSLKVRRGRQGAAGCAEGPTEEEIQDGVDRASRPGS